MEYEGILVISAGISLYSMFLLKSYLDIFLIKANRKRAILPWLFFFAGQMYINMKSSNHLWGSNLLLTLITVGFVGVFGYAASLWMRCTFAMMFVALCGLVEMFFLLGYDILFGPAGNNNCMLGVLLLSKLAMLPFVIGIYLFIKKKGVVRESFDKDIFMILPLMAAMMVYYSFFMIVERVSLEANDLLWWLLPGTVALIVLNLFMYPFYIRRLEEARIKKNEQIYLKQMDLFKEQCQLEEEEAKELHTSWHDLKQKLIYIHELVKHEEKEKMLTVLAEMIGETNKGKALKGRTGNLVIDSLVNHLCMEAQARGIQLNTKIKLPNKLNIEDTDLCILQGNAFDNALEALEDVDRENRQMWLEMRYERGSLLFYIKNRYMGILNQGEDGLFKTNKKEGIHGLGLQSMKKVVNKYNGNMITQGKDGFFTLKAVLYER